MSEETGGPRDVDGRRKGTHLVTWFHKNPALSNQLCLYCGRPVGADSPLDSDKEHLIARRMVPPNGFADPTAFNFLFRACRDCNEEKAALEDHVSAVTLLTSPGRTDERVDAAARRKGANSFDPRHKGKPVAEVRNTVTVKMGGIFTFELVSAAQLDRDKVRLLAFRHVQGLFSLVTSENPRAVETTRVLSPANFGFFGHYPHRDWGNPQLLEVARHAAAVPEIAAVTTANGYFRCTLRREAPPGSPWFWALEWNKSLRLIGWIGDPEAPPALFANLPDAGWQVTHHKGGGFTRFRNEKPLSDTEDALFSCAGRDLAKLDAEPATQPASAAGPRPVSNSLARTNSLISSISRAAWASWSFAAASSFGSLIPSSTAQRFSLASSISSRA